MARKEMKAKSPLAPRVYECLGRIPAGKVVTYGQMAAAVGCGSAQAVGQALRRNPDAPRVPCHRVVSANGSLTGYQGSAVETTVSRKRDLLKEEGVIFREDGRVDLERSGWTL